MIRVLFATLVLALAVGCKDGFIDNIDGAKGSKTSNGGASSGATSGSSTSGNSTSGGTTKEFTAQGSDKQGRP